MIKSALAHFADSSRTSPDVREVPIGDLSRCSKLSDLLDHLVGAGEQANWHSEAERLGSLEVDHQLVLGWSLHRQVGRFLTLEDAINILSRLTEKFDAIGSITHQPALSDKEPAGVDRGQLVTGRQRDDQIAMNGREPACGHDQPAVRNAPKCPHGLLDLLSDAHVDRAYVDPERRRCGLDDGELANPSSYDWVSQHRSARHARCNLLRASRRSRIPAASPPGAC